MKKRVALYPGTFDPLTLGHLDIISRAVKLVDHLVIGVATNPSKSPLFTLKERVAMIRHETKPLEGDGRATISVQAFDHLLIEFAEKVGAGMIVRGLRAVSDFEYEFQMVGMNQRLNADIETVFLMADPRHQAIASRLVKEIAMLGGDVTPFTSPHVAKLLVTRCKKLGKRK
ncbi:MAG: pantetheine-phosphate adenylyltransferase [Alphaproteobacteria bacterium]|nr:pantetheine-phosphate adenylyltransferase [Alphaproteobacteria bacterium]MDE2110358.1 pantetheine-phosphate adenylyltransferase [Alphaproteobacteria bacterium]MDE2495214.1 pantetheine-phosphate adenylyltransferase [Alphaproteobacteria bacterium]